MISFLNANCNHLPHTTPACPHNLRTTPISSPHPKPHTIPRHLPIPRHLLIPRTPYLSFVTPSDTSTSLTALALSFRILLARSGRSFWLLTCTHARKGAAGRCGVEDPYRVHFMGSHHGCIPMRIRRGV